MPSPPPSSSADLHSRDTAAAADPAAADPAAAEPAAAEPAAGQPLVVLFGPTASGKTSLALALARRFGGEIVSCDSLCVYRGMNIGTAKPTAAERAEIPHHCLDLYPPDQPCTAGDYARAARPALDAISARGRLPIVAGGTGLYLRALLEGLFPAPAGDLALRTLLRVRSTRRSPQHLHRTLRRFDAAGAEAIHPNDVSKVLRAIEVSVAARRPITQQWTEGRDALQGYRILKLGLDPARPELYARINQRAAAMFAGGLVEETRALIATYGAACRPLSALGYKQAAAVLDGSLTEPEAITLAQAGHRHYAKRQMTWFRREAGTHWLQNFGGEAEPQAVRLVQAYLTEPAQQGMPGPTPPGPRTA